MSSHHQLPVTNSQSSCGCCEGIEKLTPMSTANRPGLDALAYRAGAHAAFLETMLARLSNLYLDIPRDELDEQGRPRIDRIYPLHGLTTRAAGDPSIALLDAWATVGDVLTFYQERIANEGYLRTATERRSILELARLVGYALRPGVAASVYLAYTLDSNFKDEVIIPAGARSQSVPGPGELPQSFETSEPLKARAAWNVLKPRMTRPQTATTIKSGRLYLKGSTTNLKPNDPLLIDLGMGEAPVLYRVMDALADAAADRTLVTLQAWSGVAKTAQTVASPEAIAAETKRRLSDIVARYLGEEADKIGLSRGTRLFKRVSDYLQSLQQRLVEDVPFPEMIAYLNEETLPQLATQRQAAERRAQYTELRPWLENMVAELGGVAESASALRAESLAREFTLAAAIDAGGDDGGDTGDEGSAGAMPDDEFKDALAGLVKPASVPPSSALTLQRSIAVAFQPKADTHLQMVGAFRADVRESLPTVVANTKVTPDIAIKVYALRVKASLFGHNAPKKPIRLNETTKVMETQEWGASDMIAAGDIMPVDFGEAAVVYAGTAVYLDTSYDKILPGSWVVVDTSAVDTNTTGPVRVVEFPTLIAKAMSPKADISRAEYGLTGKSTRIELADPSDVSQLKQWIRIDAQSPYLLSLVYSPATNEFQIIRRTTVYAQSEELPLAEEPIDDPICGSDDASAPDAFIELDDVYSQLQAGRWLIVSGERTDIQTVDPNDPRKTVPVTGVKSSELVMLSEVVQRVPEAGPAAQARGYYGYGPQPVRSEKIHTYIRLARKLEYCYKRDTVTIYGNVVKATHGETRNEVLGSGDGSKAFQSFVLKQPPLTYVAAPTPAGAESTLKVYVNDVQWHVVDALAGLQPTHRNFITKTDDDDKTSVIFGNGRWGARPPTGIENIKAVYRNGIGKAGNAKAEQISLLATRPLGVKEVINPLRASGGADKESRDQARRNAPLAVMALDRLVSVQDYADFARTFAGIGKASAARLSDGRRQLVHVTISGADDIPIDKTSDLYRNLVKALRDFGDPYQPIQVEVRELMLIVLSANVRIQPDYQWESVVTKIRAKLLDTLSFENRELGQDVVLSAVISAIQSVAGAAYVDVDLLGGVSEKNETGTLRTPKEIAGEVQRMIAKSKTTGPTPRVKVNLAEAVNGVVRPAQLAFLTPDVEATLILNEVKS